MSGAAEDRRDFFISYTSTDEPWAEWIAWELEAAGYSTILQAWDFQAGHSFVQAMHEAAQLAKRTAVILTPHYLQSRFGEAEWQAAFVQDPTGEQGLLIPVRVETVAPPGLLATRVHVDLVGLDESAARTTLLRRVDGLMRGRSKPTTAPQFPSRLDEGEVTRRPPFPTGAGSVSRNLPSVWNLPYLRNPDFTGREDLLVDLEAHLAERESTAVSKAIIGMGGVGKTALAVEYVYRHRFRFDVVWWVRAGEPATLVGDYAELATQLALPERNHPDQQAVLAAVRRWLADHGRWLLILDGAKGPETVVSGSPPARTVGDFLPQVGDGQVLVTSSDASWERVAAPVAADVFSPDQAVAFLRKRTGSGDIEAAGRLAAEVGYLPLALEQAGAYIQEVRISIATYLQRLPALISKGRPRDYGHTVASTWQLSIEQVSASAPAAAYLLEVCAFVAPEEVPRELLAHGPLAGTAELASATELAALLADPIVLDEAIGLLHRYCLVKATEEVVLVHRLVQEVVRQQLDHSGRKSSAGIAVRLLAAAFPIDSNDAHTWPVCVRLLPHAVTAIEHAIDFKAEAAATIQLSNGVVSYLRSRGDLFQAKRLLERVLPLALDLGSDHLEVAHVQYHLGQVLRDLGSFREAKGALERALAIFRTELGLNHVEVARTLNALGTVLPMLDLTAAKAAQEEALAIFEARFGPNHLDVAWSLGNLGNLLRDVGDLTSAKVALQRALGIRESHLGPNHERVAWTLTSMSNVQRDLGDFPAAKANLQRALTILEREVGPDHPELAWALTSMGDLQRDLGDLPAAKANLERALTIFESRLGPNHFEVAKALNGLGLVLAGLGDLQEARANLERALMILEREVGPDHPELARALTSMGNVLRDLGDPSAAKANLERALMILESRLGPNHFEVARARKNLHDLTSRLNDELGVSPTDSHGQPSDPHSN